MNLLTNISDFYHGTDVLNYYCRVKCLSEGDLFLTLKPVNSSSPDRLYQQISSLLDKYPIKCVGVIEAERSVFQNNIQNYRDQFIPPSFFHCHMIAKNNPEILSLGEEWIDLNEGYVQTFTRKEVNNINGLVCYLSKQINANSALKIFEN